jgi:serine phosphatase RsbU (regulator of sigma subunit)
VEAIDNNDQQFGMERLIKIFRDKPYLQAAQFVELIKKEVEQFTEGQPQFDDFTLVVLKVV